MEKWQENMITAMKIIQDSCQYTTGENEFKNCYKYPFIDWCLAIGESEGVKSIKSVDIYI